MSKAEDIAKQIADKKIISSAGVKTWKRMIEDALQEHTNATLNDLKEKVEDKRDQIQLVLDKGQSKHAFTSLQLEVRISELEDILQLIDEVKNE